MRTLAVIAALLIAVPSLQAHPKSIRHGKRHFYHPSRDFPRKHQPPGSDWYPHDINELPFDSPRWFDQMLRENRRNAG
jgi:hypothetical protein